MHSRWTNTAYDHCWHCCIRAEKGTDGLVSMMGACLATLRIYLLYMKTLLTFQTNFCVGNAKHTQLNCHHSFFLPKNPGLKVHSSRPFQLLKATHTTRLGAACPPAWNADSVAPAAEVSSGDGEGDGEGAGAAATAFRMYGGCMDGWVGGREGGVGGRVGGQAAGWVGGSADGWVFGRAGGWTGGRVAGGWAGENAVDKPSSSGVGAPRPKCAPLLEPSKPHGCLACCQTPDEPSPLYIYSRNQNPPLVTTPSN